VKDDRRATIGRARAASRARAVAFVALTGAAFAALVTLARDPIAEAAPTKPRRPAKPKRDAGPAAPGSSVDASAPLATGNASAPPRAAAASSPDAGGAVLEARGGGDGGTKVFRFGEVEIEGRLRSPQLVYFLRRVRAEFAAGDLGHRSFMGELSQTRQDPSF